MGGAGVPVTGTFDELLDKVDIMLDATSAGIGAKNKQLYQQHELKAVFQGGEAGEVADVFFHGYANYDKGVGADYLKLTSCNTTGLIRAVDALDRLVGVEKVAITIIRRVADPGELGVQRHGREQEGRAEPDPGAEAVAALTVQVLQRVFPLTVAHRPPIFGQRNGVSDLPRR